MNDIYFENKETGELLPSGEAIREFYKTHKALDDWQTEWKETNISTGTIMAAPNFVNAIA